MHCNQRDCNLLIRHLSQADSSCYSRVFDLYGYVVYGSLTLCYYAGVFFCLFVVNPISFKCTFNPLVHMYMKLVHVVNASFVPQCNTTHIFCLVRVVQIVTSLKKNCGGLGS